MEIDFSKYNLNPLVNKNMLKKFGFHYDYKNDHYVYTEYIYKRVVELQVNIDIEQNWFGCIVIDSNHDRIYSSYYNRQYGNNNILKKFDENIKKILNKMEKNNLIVKSEDKNYENFKI